MTAAQYLDIAVSSPLRRTFHYLPETDRSCADYPLGVRVRVPFGRRSVVGIVAAHCPATTIEPSQLKQVTERLDDTALLPDTILALLHWQANYYHGPLGEALLGAFPAILRKGGPVATHSERHWRISDRGLGLDASALQRAPRQQQAFSLLLHEGSMPETALVNQGLQVSVLRTLQKKGLLSSEDQPCAAGECPALITGDGSTAPLPASAEQQLAIDTLLEQGDHFHISLLEGVTGSGKTEVYLQAIATVLDRGGQAMVLIPEIGLTAQTVGRFSQRFATQIAVFHSGLTDRERLVAWNAARNGDAGIVIGTRSAIFTPLARPGLIVIDEEHDPSFKQQDGLRYSARDSAIYRARAEKIPIILGSATPSLESLHNAQCGKYQHLILTHRAGNAPMPSGEFIDIRHLTLHEGLSDAAIAAIASAVQAGEQVMVFVNRRGFAPLLMCHDCGWHAECNHCDARLTLHQRPRRLHCHHCDQQTAMPQQCPRCQSSQLLSIGQGTQRSAEALRLLFPDTPLIRIDRDSTSRKDAFNREIDTILRGDPAILVGTQMLAKGHHFPRLSTVVVLDIDQGLYNPDFRGPEKTLQLLSQVAGRAGREQLAGRVLIQTHLPDHPLLTHWRDNSYQGCTAQLLAERRAQHAPPFTYMACLRADAKKPGQAMHALAELVQQCFAGRHRINGESDSYCQLLGPLPAVMERRAGWHRAQLVLNASHRKLLHQCVAQCVSTLGVSGKNGLRWAVDIDPQELL